MSADVYRYNQPPVEKPNRKFKRVIIIALVLLGVGIAAYVMLKPTPVEKAVNQLQFDDSITEAEKQTVRQAIQSQSKTYEGRLSTGVNTSLQSDNQTLVLSAYLPVTNIYSTRQSVTKTELADISVYMSAGTGEKVRTAIANALGLDPNKLTNLDGAIKNIPDKAVVFISANDLSSDVKLLGLEDDYWLDNFKSGAVFRQAVFTGPSATSLADLKLNDLATKDTTLKVNMTGVTALTRTMIQKLGSVKDATYFSAKIGDFLADADITHVSNEVSFKPNCAYSHTVFCSPPQMIDALKASGVDLIELTGNHNNDVGNQYNTDTIKQYHGLGWHTFGGGLNTAEAAKPYIADKKDSKVAFLGYNYPDAPSGGAIAKASTAGANPYNVNKVEADIKAAKKTADFVIVNVQFWECYAYPDGYEEFPVCDSPIAGQQAVFKKIVDLGADMVIGTQAHQPQTYEIYKGKPIYYGLGNMYFEQTQWPGTERGIILSHYFVKGKLLQTRLSPTVYDTALQTRLMTNTEAVKLLDRLDAARP